MVVIVLEKVNASVRGELTRWMLEVKAGVFVGTMSALVRQKLWEKVCNKAKDGSCLLIHNYSNEQGFAIHTCGKGSREITDLEGLTLVRSQ
jgi:CRISPR-associated protein Cas2